MFNRVLQVRMVRNNRRNAEPTVDQTGPDFESKTQIVVDAVVKVAVMVGIGIACFVVLDTGRQVAVERAHKA